MRTSHAKSDINITPLIDIVLVLLIVFIVLVPSLAKATNAVLPTLDPGRLTERPTPLVVSLDAEGRLFLQQDAIPWNELPERLAPSLLLQPLGGRKVFLKVDGSLPHGHAVRAMDMIRVGADLARTRTALRSDLGGEDGGGTKVVVSLKKS
jgi:biopolymer transport protein TolR